MNKFLVGALIVLAGGVFGWYYMGDGGSVATNDAITSTPSVTGNSSGIVGTTGVSPTSSSPEQVPITTMNVVYADSGFSPAKTTVKKGTAVSFINQSAGQMWIASDVHPTHQLLPGFDQFKGEAKGATYTYTFMKVGTWTYHNHVSPSMTGTVTVTE